MTHEEFIGLILNRYRNRHPDAHEYDIKCLQSEIHYAVYLAVHEFKSQINQISIPTIK